MKKKNIILSAIVVEIFLTNCNSIDITESIVTKKDPISILATTDGIASRTILNNDYMVIWATGDKITIANQEFTLEAGDGTTNATFTGYAPADGTYDVYYPSTYDGTNWPSQFYVNENDISGAPMKANATISNGQVSNILNFTNEGGILKYTVKGNEIIKSINLKATTPDLDVTLNCGAGVALTPQGTVFNIAVPAGVYNNAILTFTSTSNKIAKKTASTFIVTKNKISLVTFDATSLFFEPQESLCGEFIISTNPLKKIQFSRGNLYCKDNGNNSIPRYTFAFEEKQYYFRTRNIKGGGACLDGIPYTDSNNVTPENTSGLFTWGINNGDYGAFQDYGVNGVGININWGYAMGLSSGWTTLSKDEYEGLVGNNSSQESTICGVPGMVFAPGLGKSIANSYDESTWETAEAIGFVFFPFTGYFSDTKINNIGRARHYWSSTEYTQESAWYFNCSSVGAAVRSFGVPVRLIKIVR